MNGGQPLGQILVEERLIEPAALEMALLQQKSRYEPLGTILLRMKVITEYELEKVLTHQFGFVHLNPKTYRMTDKSLLDLIPVEVTRKYHCFPLEKNKQILKVAIVDPLDTDALVVLNDLTRLTIQFIASRQVWIDELIDIYFAGKVT